MPKATQTGEREVEKEKKKEAKREPLGALAIRGGGRSLAQRGGKRKRKKR